MTPPGPFTKIGRAHFARSDVDHTLVDCGLARPQVTIAGDIRVSESCKLVPAGRMSVDGGRPKTFARSDP
jgi:hypothetical protein